jgi:S1-C subfamily serine protease
MKKVVIAVFMVLALSGLAHAQFGGSLVTEVVDKAGDSVVSIDVNRVVFGARQSGLGGNVAGHTRLATNFLTGFVYKVEDGAIYIMTDNRSIEDATILTVWLNDGTELEAEVVGTDDEYGVGVIKIDPADLPENASIKEADLMLEKYDQYSHNYPYDQGDPVVALGNSGGLTGTVTFGVISGIRNFRNRSMILVPNMIQSDVSINAGNEGCPLFNERGEIIGIHERIGSGMQNTTFFTPVWLLTRVADELILAYEEDREADVWHPWLGIKPYAGSTDPFSGRPRVITDDLKMFIDLPYQYWDVGILLDSVYLESPAREFGLMGRDILMEVTVLDVDGNVRKPKELLESIDQLELMVTTAQPEDLFIFGLYRDYNYLEVEVIIDDHPGSFQFVSGDDIELSQDYF